GPHEVVVEYFQEGGEAFAEIGYQQQGGDGEAPAAPADLAAKAVPAPRAGDGKGAKEDKAGTAGAIELTWSGSESPDAASYRVYRGPSDASAGGLEPLAGAESLDGTEFVDSTAEPEAAYSYGVTALDAAGNESPLSLTTTAMVGAAALDATAAPSGPAATAGDGSVTLTWTASAGADIAGYRVYRSLQPVVPETGELYSGATPLTRTTFTGTAATNGTTYFYVVTAVDLAGAESPPSNEAWAVPNPPNTTLVKVDFTATGETPATGYAADWGQAFGPRSDANQGSGLSYGWKTLDGNPLSLVGNGRDRGRAGIDERLDSVLHMQYGDDPGTNGIKTEGQWELAVPDGLYEVTVAAGDMRHASGYDSLHAINVEAGDGIETFQSTDGQQNLAKTVTVGVWDGALTITAAGGRNTKIAYIDVVGKPRAPHVDTMRPDNRTTGHDPADGVSATIRVPYAGVGVDAATLPGNVHIYETATGAEVPSSTGTSGGNDVISTQPDAPLKPNTSYRFEVTAGVKDNFGASFVPFTSVFTTGAGVTETPAEATPLTGISFDKVEQPEAAGYYWSSMAFGPDGKLYASSIGQGISRFTVAEDGSLTAREDLGYEGRAIIGLVFDKSATADDLKVWITSTSANTFNETGEWVSGVSLLTGASLENEARILEHLPRSQADHLTNPMASGLDGRLYFLQGSNQAAGGLDNSWGQRGEQLLTAAVLVFDPDHSAVRQAAATGVPIDVKTAQGGTYDPYQPGAPLQIHATGIRNAYDLVWH
ncbi:hypothetical protein HER39_07845, partial [Arthrobacter deserti]|nr:hypothetical protein [Arthrobacter deserti]